MSNKRFKPNTPGTRNKRGVDSSLITSSTPRKSLTTNLSKSNGRSSGRITVLHKGGGVKRRFRKIDFKRQPDVSGTVKTIEYDPNRSAYISLIKNNNGSWGYILTPRGISIGDVVQSGDNSEINVGCSLTLKNIPIGSIIHNIELLPGKGAQLVRSAGNGALLMAKSSRHATVKLPSGEVRLILLECAATYGRLANEKHSNIRRGKAGIVRKLGVRPTVRGAAKNRCDHAHGGGEGRAPVGKSEPRTAYGKKANIKTRRRDSKHVVKSRKG
ncbi:MAG: 50S ribosomal protein L2 [Candidatus Margulisbacteria bacterium]|nr:50S ribosomal protein L2 [Candidatus Margulisiibacteriota bacterium]